MIFMVLLYYFENILCLYTIFFHLLVNDNYEFYILIIISAPREKNYR